MSRCAVPCGLITPSDKSRRSFKSFGNLAASFNLSPSLQIVESEPSKNCDLLTFEFHALPMSD